MPGGGLTLMAVHAHPDDEALFTGGILATSADRGITTVLVTCTDGDLGYAPGGLGPDQPGHDQALVVATRSAELAASCDVLGITHAERLGYHDSGMMGWPHNDRPQAFCNAPLDAVADRLGALLQRYRPQVVVTYDADGFYGHPDHIQTHRATVAAVERCGLAVRLFYVAVARSLVSGFAELAAASGMVMPDWVNGQPPFGTDDERIAAVVDCTAAAARKHDALAAHASQVDNQFFLDMAPDLFALVFGTEMFVLAGQDVGPVPPRTDLFDGLG